MTLKARINAFNIFYINTCMEFFIFLEVTRGAIMLLYAHYHIQGANGPVDQVLAGPLFLKVKKSISSNKQKTGVVFGLIQLVILRYSR